MGVAGAGLADPRRAPHHLVRGSPPWFAVPRRLLGLIIGFGAGALVAVAALKLTLPAFRGAGDETTGIWLAVGAITFYVADRVVAPPGAEG